MRYDIRVTFTVSPPLSAGDIYEIEDAIRGVVPAGAGITCTGTGGGGAPGGSDAGQVTRGGPA